MIFFVIFNPHIHISKYINFTIKNRKILNLPILFFLFGSFPFKSRLTYFVPFYVAYAKENSDDFLIIVRLE